MKLSEVMEIVERKGVVNAQLISEVFEVDTAKACRILKACWDRGLLMPVAQSFFAPPNEDGSPVVWARYGRTGGENTLARRKLWFDKEIKLILDYMKMHESGKSIQDLVAAVDVPEQSIRKVMKVLVDAGDLVQMTADAGGAFGKRPLIYALDEDGLQIRNQKYIDAAPAKKEAKRVITKKKTGELDVSKVTEADFATKVVREQKVDFDEEG